MCLTKRLPDSRKSRSISNSVKSTQNNTTRFMKKYDIDNYDTLLKKSTENIGWYWEAVNEDLGLKWFRCLRTAQILVF